MKNGKLLTNYTYTLIGIREHIYVSVDVYFVTVASGIGVFFSPNGEWVRYLYNGEFFAS